MNISQTGLKMKLINENSIILMTGKLYMVDYRISTRPLAFGWWSFLFAV
jgi:hypothetical protein